ncbi:MAG: hypothetical protein KA152_07230 [Verrucomicrobiales bacterium]|nr:hypothetical protein [Verrucomicrobiales bacterium]
MKTYSVHYSPSLDLDTASVLEDFSFPWLDRPCPVTSFRAVWNEERLRFRFDVEDDDLVLDETGEPHAAALGSDRVELFFATSADLSTPYYGAEMEPRGSVYDYQAIYHRKFDDSWCFDGLEFTGEILEGGYLVEGTITLQSLRELGCLMGSEMIAGVYRAEFSHGPDGIVQDWISWIDPQVTTPDFHVPSSFGKFLFLD